MKMLKQLILSHLGRKTSWEQITSGICLCRKKFLFMTKSGVRVTDCFAFHNNISVWLDCLKSAQIRSFFWSLFSGTRSKYRNLRSKSPHSVRVWKNTDQKNSEILIWNIRNWNITKVWYSDSRNIDVLFL